MRYQHVANSSGSTIRLSFIIIKQNSNKNNVITINLSFTFRWVVLVDMLGSEETPEDNDHIPEGDYYSSNNSPLPFPQFQLSSRHSSTSFRFCHHFQTLLILPTTVLKEI